MKFLKLKFEDARLIKDKPLKNMLGTNRFFHPINKMHVYNSFCVLLGRTPKPQLRATNDKYMPFFDEIMELVSEGYIKIKVLSTGEQVTAIKKSWNANITEAKEYTWRDCAYVIGTLMPVFVYHVSQILDMSPEDVNKKQFQEIINSLQSMGVKNDGGEFVFTDEKINNLITWLKFNACTALSNFIENKQMATAPTRFGKRVHRGIIKASRYCGEILIPLSDEIHDELCKHSKGFSTILDGGLVTIVGYGEVSEDDIHGFIEIKNLNSLRKFDKETSGVVWDNTIYKRITSTNLVDDINSIIKDSGVSIVENQKGYDEMISKVTKIKFNGTNVGEIAYKVNHFIERCIEKQYE